MNLLLDQPVWLSAATLGLIAALIGWRALRALSTDRRIIAVGSRLLLFAVLALALAAPQIIRTSDTLTVITLIDTSSSVRAYAPTTLDDQGVPVTIADQILTRIDNDTSRQDTDRLGLLAFDALPKLIASPTPAPLNDPSFELPTTEGTDIPSAIRAAQALVPPDSRARILLISDGQNTGTDPESLPLLAPIDVVPIDYTITNEVILESVRAPSRARPGSVIPVEITLRSTTNAQGTLALTVNATPIDLDPDSPSTDLPLALTPGTDTITVRAPIDQGRVHRIRAIWIPANNDTSIANNESSTITLARDQGRALVVLPSTDSEDQATELLTLLDSQNWTTDTLLPSNIPADLIELESYDLIVLVNTPRDVVPRRAELALINAVRALGVGLVFVGGDQALSAGAWKGSDLADIIPLNLDVPDDVVKAHVAVALVLDSSGSMSRSVLGSSSSQQTVANEAAAGAIEVLDQSDFVSVIAFSSTARTVVPIQRNDNTQAIQQRIRTITPSGGTNLEPALNLAKQQLLSVESNTKHIVVLSDGSSQNAPALPGIAQQLASEGIKVSTITIGDNADEMTMRLIAQESGGLYYRVINPSVLPRVFLKAVRVLRKPMIREGVITPVILEPTSPLALNLPDLPPISGLVVTEFKSNDPRVMTPIVSDQGEPILAAQQTELGRVTAFTSDTALWTRSWIQSGASQPLWSRIIAWTARDETEGLGSLRTIVNADSLTLEYEAINDTGAPIDGATVTATLYDTSGTNRTTTLTQTAPGRYESTVNAITPGDHVIVVSPTVVGEPQAPTIAAVHVSPQRELATLQSSRATLERLAQRSGGRVLDLTDPTLPIFDRSNLDPVRTYEPIWRALILTALILFLLDLTARRLAWDRWLAQARAETIAVTQRVQADRLSTVQHRQRTDPHVTIEPERKRRRKPAPSSPTPDSTEPRPEPPAEESSLLAAKRRARERFDDQSS